MEKTLSFYIHTHYKTYYLRPVHPRCREYIIHRRYHFTDMYKEVFAKKDYSVFVPFHGISVTIQYETAIIPLKKSPQYPSQATIPTPALTRVL